MRKFIKHSMSYVSKLFEMGLITYIYIFGMLTLSYFAVLHLLLWFKFKDKFKKLRIRRNQLPGVSIITPAYNEESIIEDSLNNLLLVDYPKNKMQLIVVDDGSTDKTLSIVKRVAKHHSEVKWKILTSKHVGKAAAMNFAIKKANYAVIAVRDADSFLEREALKNCVAYFDKPDVAAVTSHILDRRRKTIWEKIQHIESMVGSVQKKAQELINAVRVTPGALTLYKKDLVLAVGGFDEKCLTEDLELTWRLLKSGYRIRMAFDALVYTIHPSTFQMLIKYQIRTYIGSFQTLFKYAYTLLDRKSNSVGNFLIPLVIISNFYSIFGVTLSLYFVSVKLLFYIAYSLIMLSQKINPIAAFQLSYSVNPAYFYGAIPFFLLVILLTLTFKVHNYRPGFFDLLAFVTLYPLLVNATLLISIYKFVRGERSWLTK